MTRLTALSLLIVLLGISSAPAETTSQLPGPVQCEGSYSHHLQGVCADGDKAIYWCFTTRLVKTDPSGKVEKHIEVGNHHGDLCFHQGKVYVAVNFGKFNNPEGKADSWVYVYDAADLSLLAKHKTSEVFHGAGGIDQRDGHFFVVGGLPPTIDRNFVYEYDGDFHFVKKHEVPSGNTLMGIQTAATTGNTWWFGCYGKPQVTLRTDLSFQKVDRFEFDCSLGIIPTGDGRFLVARGGRTPDKGHTGRLVEAVADEKLGLKIVEAR